MNIIFNLFKPAIISIIFIMLASGCREIKMIDELPQKTYSRTTQYYNFKSNSDLSFYVYSNKPCEQMAPINKYGNKMKLKTETGDTNYFTCNDWGGRDLILNTIKYKEQEFHCHFKIDGSLTIDNGKCSKFINNIKQNWSDSIPVCIWTTIDSKNGKMIFHLAEESPLYPFYKTNRLDSIIIDLENFCSEAETQDEKEATQSVITKTIFAKFTPNPFTDKVELQITQTMNLHLINAPMKITFYDDKGNTLLTQPVDISTTFTFSFPLVNAGKTMYYRITWDDYFIAGQILKN
ncbi:MAG: hypothetical protein H7321_00705 [Bacteroidia bacterium]|nr:hypothetical protein [Bacteroidia bacterium]